MMQCRSSPEGPPSRCVDPTISVSPSAAGCGGQDIKDPCGINLRSAPGPWCGTRAAGTQWRSRQSPPPFRSSEIWQSPPGSAQPYQEDPGRSTQLITAVPGSRPATGGNHPQDPPASPAPPLARPSGPVTRPAVSMVTCSRRRRWHNPQDTPPPVSPSTTYSTHSLTSWGLHSRLFPLSTPSSPSLSGSRLFCACAHVLSSTAP